MGKSLHAPKKYSFLFHLPGLSNSSLLLDSSIYPAIKFTSFIRGPLLLFFCSKIFHDTLLPCKLKSKFPDFQDPPNSSLKAITCFLLSVFYSLQISTSVKLVYLLTSSNVLKRPLLLSSPSKFSPNVETFSRKLPLSIPA